GLPGPIRYAAGPSAALPRRLRWRSCCEVADDRIEPQAGQVIGDAAHDLRREREVIRITTHETHGGAIRVREDGVGAEQQAAALGTLGPVCDGGAGKVATDAVQAHSRGDLAGVLPEL